MNKIVNKFKESLMKAIAEKFGEPITDATFDITPLHGGTVGDVRLISGIAKMSEKKELPFKIVHKTQKKWERNFDAGSWRREYDLYACGIDALFDESLRSPKCYYQEITDDEVQIWMEYVEGVSGLDLTGAMYECAAEELGMFQGRLYAQKADVLKKMTNLSEVEFAKKSYLHYRSWNEVFDYIRSENCEIPKHLCKMLIDVDEHFDTIWEQIESLPVVWCHRDFWITNIFYSNGNIRVIDWDTAGWGYLGEDIASLIADEADVEHMVEYYRSCVPAYYKGFSEYVDISYISKSCIWEMMIIIFGYRLVEWYKFAESEEVKHLQIQTLQKIYEMEMNPYENC
ncbi:aminoglycoside phosphotransferase family protein [Robinsoniella peoriensis]|uniref:Putative phosphotransferase n=1 Tax=Robinsoniella peoriensis TaxID=180332 RepID=A0A4U8QD41_9FIRM|nr:aminoglycoside phosphotransferase family protein [Robinsoniella peoriensis]MDU7029976.1 aminoglycoside phosphotransferase family protein [Clostridiales bacterium]TLD02679.1 putative phosphotransferase [Robinsoniella peoriensis]